MLLVDRQVYGNSGLSTIVALFLKLIEADCDGLSRQKFCWHGPGESDLWYLDYLRVKEMVSTLEQQQGNCLDLVSLLHLMCFSGWCLWKTTWIEPLALALAIDSTYYSQLNIGHIIWIVQANLIHIHQIWNWIWVSKALFSTLWLNFHFDMPIFVSSWCRSCVQCWFNDRFSNEN